MREAESERSWTVLEQQTLYAGWSTLVGHTVQIDDGSTIQYEVDESIPFAVAVLVIDGPDVLLARQYRHPVGRWIFDLPAGAGEPGELPVEAARRELEEELGLVATELRPLHTFYPNPGKTAWPVHIFSSTSGITAGQADRSNPAEQVRLARVSVLALDDMILSGEIVDPALIIARATAAARGALPPLAACSREDAPTAPSG